MTLTAQGADAWKEIVRDRLPLYGHRNWIVIADSAYPVQNAAGIETVVADTDQLTAVREVMAALAASKHVRPIVHLDAELAAIPEALAPGIDQYRQDLAGILGEAVTPVRTNHLALIGTLANASEQFRILIIKTTFTLPYTSVFLELDCAYWGPEKEKQLRSLMRR